MLVLSRKIGQKLIIADDIEITILEVRGDIVKVGINAPKDVSVFREEVYEEMKKNPAGGPPAAQQRKSVPSRNIPPEKQAPQEQATNQQAASPPQPDNAHPVHTSMDDLLRYIQS